MHIPPGIFRARFLGNINHIKIAFFLYETTPPDPDGMWYRICSGRGMHNHCSTITFGNTDDGTTNNTNGTGTGNSARCKYRYPLWGTGLLWLYTRRFWNATGHLHPM